MSDNNKNDDPNELPNGDTHLNKPENKEIPKKDPEVPSDPSSENDDIEIRKQSDEPEIDPVIKDNEENDKELPKQEISSEITDDISKTSSEDSPGQAEPVKLIPEKTTEDSDKPPIPPPVPKISSKPKDSNYQISLIDENLLKVIVSTNRVVKIDSTVKEDKASTETQSNEINLHPGTSFSIQEVEVLIAIEDPKNENVESVDQPIEDDKLSGAPEIEEIVTEKPEEPSKSNYQLNLINENLLKIKILTNKVVRIESTARDRKTWKYSRTGIIKWLT